MWTPIVSRAIGFALLFAPSVPAAASANSGHAFQEWQVFRDALKSNPDVLRYYTFQQTSRQHPIAKSLTGQSVPLRYSGRSPFEIVPGRWPDKKAVRIDAGAFQAAPFDIVRRSFTVAIWFRKHGQGKQLGNGRTNGMLLAQGSGYWDGLRVWTSYPDQRVHVELGRPKPKNSFGFTTETPAPDGVWQHLAVTWDGAELRLYLNGVLSASAAYAGDYTPPSSSLRIGYADSGIGSIKLDVDEVLVFRRALTATEVLQQFCLQTALPTAEADRFTKGTDALARHDWLAADEPFAALASSIHLAPIYRAVAQFSLAESLRRRSQRPAALDIYARLFDAPDTPDRLRQLALRLCLPGEHDVVRVIGSREFHQRLAALPELSPEQHIAVQQCLAERCLQDGDDRAARRIWQKLVAEADISDHDRWNLRLQIAHSFRTTHQYATARTQYQILIDDRTVPPEVRSNAWLCLADCLVHEGKRKAAIAEWNALAATADLPAHHRDEARRRADEVRRIESGLPARDPAASRTPIEPLPKPGRLLHVARNGRDADPGTEQQPLATLVGARNAIRQLKATQGLPRGGVTVLIHEGVYPVRETFQLEAGDSGTAEAPVVYRSAPDSHPRFSGGVDLRQATPVTDARIRDRLTESVRDRVLQIDLRQNGVRDFGRIEQRGYGMSGYPAHPWVDLYVDDTPMDLARWPNAGFVKVGPVVQGRFRTADSARPGRFGYDFKRPDRWADTRDVWMFGYWGHLWAARGLQIAKIARTEHQIQAVQGTGYGFRENQPYYFFNILEELDRPGEWYLDRKTGFVYFLPPENSQSSHIEFPILSAPFLELTDASHVVVKGLAFELGRAEGAVVTGGHDVLFAGCTFRKLGTNGIIVRGGSHHGILGCDLSVLGAGGVRMTGGDRKTLTPGRHFVENCHIQNFARIDRVYAPAVHLDGVGNRIAHNLFHDSPHHALRVEGYEQRIEFNEIHSVVYEADDQAGIDIYGNPAYRGNVIRYNFWHHIGSGHNVAGQAGIRLDDFISDVLIYGNVFYRCSGGKFGAVQIHGGKDNIVDNNLFIDCKYAVSFSPWGEKRWRDRLRDPRTQAVIRSHGVDITKPPHVTRYPDLKHLESNPDRNFLWRNLAVKCSQFRVRDRGSNRLMDNHQVAGDPGFADMASLDFTLDPDSAVYDRFGFRPIPFREIGLYDDENRARWPVHNEVSKRYVRGD